MTLLLDALAAIGLLAKRERQYHLPRELSAWLTHDSPHSWLSIIRNHGPALRSWAQLAKVVKTGRQAEYVEGICGEEGELAAFIGGMDEVSRPLLERVVSALRPIRFRTLLDVGGASGSYTIAFLRECPRGKAILFDLPEVIPMARERLRQAGLLDRVQLVEGDFGRDELPGGADFIWISAITHMNNAQQNRDLYAKCFRAMADDGRLVIRDILMDPSHVQPAEGALFAINMLAQTPGGSTYSLDEYEADLRAAGFGEVSLLHPGQEMDALVLATKGPAK
jgi:hypothetical protein